MRRAPVLALGLLCLGVAGPAAGQRPESVDATPAWPSRYRAGERVDLQRLPGGRPPSAVGGAAAAPRVIGRILPPAPPGPPGAGLRTVE